MSRRLSPRMRLALEGMPAPIEVARSPGGRARKAETPRPRPRPKRGPRPLTVRDVSRLLGLAQAHVATLDDELEPIRVGRARHRVYDPARVAAYLEEHPRRRQTWLSEAAAAAALLLTPAELAGLADRLAPETHPSGRRRYHRDAIRAEARRRGIRVL